MPFGLSWRERKHLSAFIPRTIGVARKKVRKYKSLIKRTCVCMMYGSIFHLGNGFMYYTYDCVAADDRTHDESLRVRLTRGIRLRASDTDRHLGDKKKKRGKKFSNEVTRGPISIKLFIMMFGCQRKINPLILLKR